jgi:hypothetical protein
MTVVMPLQFLDSKEKSPEPFFDALAVVSYLYLHAQ